MIKHISLAILFGLIIGQGHVLAQAYPLRKLPSPPTNNNNPVSLPVIGTGSLNIPSAPPPYDNSGSRILQYDSANQVFTIQLVPNLGTNISFEQRDEVMETVILNNPSWIKMSYNGCFSAVGSNCSRNSAATMLNLVSAGNSSNRPRESLLTISTLGNNNKRQTYVFRISDSQSGSGHIALIQFVNKK